MLVYRQVIVFNLTDLKHERIHSAKLQKELKHEKSERQKLKEKHKELKKKEDDKRNKKDVFNKHMESLLDLRNRLVVATSQTETGWCNVKKILDDIVKEMERIFEEPSDYYFHLVEYEGEL